MKAFVTGAGGQLGRALLARVPEGSEAVGFRSAEVDVADSDAVLAAVERERPDWILNAAAYTAVDAAENDRDTAYGVNDRGTGNLVAAAAAVGARVAHVSTDFVFGGDAGRAYQVDAPTAPLGVYGASKLAGEQQLRSEDLCVRTAWVYAAEGKNFVQTMLRLMADREELGVVADQIGSPTSADDLADAVWGLALGGHSGTFHFTDSGAASWYDFAVAIRDEGIALDLLPTTAARVKPIRTADYPTPAQRPSFSVLDCTATAAALGGPAPHWRHSLVTTLEQIKRHV